MTLLDPRALERLGSLELRARDVVEGVLSGLHRSPHHGASVEFAEHKEYAPGDEIRHIDWKAYGKFDRYYVKRFEEETELTAHLVVDVSASMGYRGNGESKLDHARLLAAALGWLLLRQGDKVGLQAFSDGPTAAVPARGRSSHLHDLIAALQALEAAGHTKLRPALLRAAEARRRSLIVLLSDLFADSDEDDAEVVRLLGGLRARGHDVVVLHILDHDELTLPFDGTAWFEAMEGEGRVLAEPDRVREAYLEEIGRFVEGWRHRLAEADVEYRLVDTSRPPAEVLVEMLRGRGRRSRR
jgi:uncharacterized protein (DUF58 family)